MSPFFIKHPIIAGVISIVTTMLGIICMMGLPISQYPDIAPVTIQLSATYPGANAQEVADSVATPIELQLSGMQGLDYISSTSSNNGSCSINVIFEPGTDANTDQQLTYMKYSQATSQLPNSVAQMGITIKQSSGLPMVLYAIDSPQGFFKPIDLTGYAYLNLVDPIKRVKGVGDCMVFGGRYAIRIWLDSEKMAQKNISVTQVYNAVSAQNAINPGGAVGAEPMPDGQEFTYTIRNKGRMESTEEFERIIVYQDDTQSVRLKDIATIELGSQSYSLAGRIGQSVTGESRPGTVLAIYQAADANALETVANLKKLFAEKEAVMPEGMRGFIALDTTTTVQDSINEIIHTLFEALVLVAFVVFLFLQGWRATLIPLIAVPVSLVTTFCFFPILGFSLNTICLLGMVLAIGLVVDDAIVVVEAVESHMENGMNPREATFAAMKEVSGPVIAIALVLAAVFLPSVLLPGITGTLFQQFAVTIAISMLISAFNALTLSPALSALLLKPKKEHKSFLTPFYNGFNKVYDKMAAGFAACCGVLCRKLYISIAALAGLTVLIIPAAKQVPGGFLPAEDQGYLLSGIIMKPGVSLQRLVEQSPKIEKALLADPAVENVVSVVGMNMMIGVQTTNAVTYFIKLKDFADRPAMKNGETPTADDIQKRLTAALGASGGDGVTFVACPPAIPGVGTGNDISFVLEDLEGQGVAALYTQVKKLEAALNAHPAIGSASDMMLPAVPQKSIAIDKEKCLAQGVDYSEANSLLQCFNGSRFVNYYTEFGQQWQVYLQADGDHRVNTDKIANFYISNKKGEKVPLDTLVTIGDIADTEFVLHNSNYNAGKISVKPADGYSSAQAMEAIEEVFSQSMDTTKFAMEYVDMSFQEKKVQDGLGLGAIFTLSGVFAFLIMAALYEKWTLPIAIFLSVPIAVLGAFTGLMLFGMTLDIYAQIGLVMLVGLAAKNAILIVEFAVLQMEKGMDLIDAAVSAARMRLRPILMTSFAFILGCVPLLTAEGSGALARNAIGVVVVIGMSVATLVGVFFIPCSFVFVMKLFRSKITKAHHGADPDEASAYAKLEAQEK
ncbi:MAG: efflux RND transporter permease subunit [Akkermansiaceae bacterium]|nr:efflux RND transporter permease subunit [Akkermansiaceae bacterium]